MMFLDRQDAGERLAKKLLTYQGKDVVVYALPRGGVVLGAEVAKELHAPLDLIITRKIGHPLSPEYAICALSETGDLVCNEEERALVSDAWFTQAVQHERDEAERRRERYLAGRPRRSARGKIAILVDDGIATGLTMRAAIQAIKRQHPLEIVVAIPVIPAPTARVLQHEVDAVVALDISEEFLGAVGAYYEDFHQVTDDEVIDLLRQNDPTYLFALPLYANLAMGLQDTLQIRQWAQGRYPNGEVYLTISADVADAHCVVLGSLMPPDVNLLVTLLLNHTMKSYGAKKVTALLPYLAYMRQEKETGGHSKTTRWIGSLLQASAIDEIVTIDAHSKLAAEIIPVPIHDYSPAEIFAQQIQQMAWQDATLVAPDTGAIPRCEAVKTRAGMMDPIVYFEKHRSPEGVQSTLHGDAGKRAIIIDDILDTGGTLLAACDQLSRKGTEEILIMVTHGLFTGEAWKGLWQYRVKTIYCTDTVPLPQDVHEDRIQVLSIIPILRRLFTEGEPEATA